MILLRPSFLLKLARDGFLPRGGVAVDTETSGLYADDGARVSTVSVSWVDEHEDWVIYGGQLTWKREHIADDYVLPIVSVAWPFDQGVTGKPEDRGQSMLWGEDDNLSQSEWEALLEWLSLLDGHEYHNAKFDLEKLRVGTRLWPGRDFLDMLLWDTQNVCHLLWPTAEDPATGQPTTGLKPTSTRLFGVEFGDEAKRVKEYLRKNKLPPGRWDLIPWDIIGDYADLDARMTKMLRLRQGYEIRNHRAGKWLGGEAEVHAAIERRLETTKVLYRMEKRGIPYDEAGSTEAGMLCRERAEVIAKPLPFRPTSPAAKDWFFTPKGLDLPPYSVTAKGSPQLTAEIVDRMVADGVPNADVWREYGKVTNAASMWYEGYAAAVGSDGRLRTCFRQNGTRSSRFSVERINLQAIPQDYRLAGYESLAGIPSPRQLIGSATAAIPGWRLWEFDLAQAELRVAAQWAKCTKMLDMITAGDDLHTYTTQELFHRGPDDKEFGRYRNVGKRANFTLLFGAGADTFRAMVSKETGIQLTDSQARLLVKDWNALYPEYKAAINHHMEVVAARQVKFGAGWIDSINKERRWFARFEDAHKAFNQRVQTNLAQFGIDWMLEVDTFLRKQGLDERGIDEGVGGVGLLLTIHDSLVVLLPDDNAGELMARWCAAAGERIWGERFTVPGGVDMKQW